MRFIIVPAEHDKFHVTVERDGRDTVVNSYVSEALLLADVRELIDHRERGIYANV